ncbi:hypothetical protein BGZ65_001614 [Modicella reniformis]|uniref:Biogenesis of lysosome-related organelles complex 1 subunit 7 n=1 Tax=Modicella reniformis TaxID=1440133 RepID=A0A9P6INK6_9FUNG|nr:hypothetical protein BGZ65_001614 [Modicella reniformis]
MSLFRKDYSAYPQPVLVRPDPRHTSESISAAVADAINSEEGTRADTHAESTASTGQNEPISERKGRLQDLSSTADKPDAAPVSDSALHGSIGSNRVSEVQEQVQQQKDSAKLADGIMSLLGPIIQEMDFNIVSVRKSQTELEKEIERLMAELQLFMESAAAPPEVEPAVQKLLKARRKIMTANTTLKAVQERVDRMQIQVERLQ